MAASAWYVFGPALEACLDGTIDLANDDFRMVLVTDSYTPNQGAHDQWDDISANEVSGTGYTTHGKALTVSFIRSGVVMTFDADNQLWTSATITAKYAVIVRDADSNGALASTDLVVAYMDLDEGGGAVSSIADDFSVAFNASGGFTFTAGAPS